MKRISLKLNQKLWLLVSSGVIFTVFATYGLTQYLYEKLYIQNIGASLIYQGEHIARMYQGKGLTPEFRSIVDRINEASEAEIFVTENPRQLGACLPFEVEYDALITREERARLVAGHTVSKVGYEERFGRQIMAVIVPLLDEKRLEGASYPLRAPPLPLGQLVEDTLEIFAPSIMEKRVRLILDADPEAIVWGDEDRLEQVVYNLCDNALKHLPEEHGVLRVEVNQIVHLHGGTFAIDSKVGEGTTVTVRLPVYAEQ